jgi:hypothetical protein
MENDAWTTVIIPFVLSVVSGTIQLIVEYRVIQPALRSKGLREPLEQMERADRPRSLSRSPRASRILLGACRVLVMFLLTFGSVSFAANIGYEQLGPVSGMAWGTIVGLVLNLVAMWALVEHSEQIAKAASILALTSVLVLTFSGLLTFTAQFVGIPISFSGGILVTVLLIVLAAVIIATLIAVYRLLRSVSRLMDRFPDSALTKWLLGEGVDWK